MVKEQKKQAVAQAKKTAKVQKKGVTKKSHKTYTKVRFYRPKTLKLNRTPKYSKTVRSGAVSKDCFDKYSVIVRPVTTEKAMKKMEEENTMVMMCNQKSSKSQIKEAFKRLYNIKVKSINTMIRPDGQKKAYIKLDAGSDSLNLANKMGII